MLQKTERRKTQAGAGTFAIVASRYNACYVEAMLRAAKVELRRAGAKKIEIIRVPGAYEIPVVAARLARQGKGTLSAIICLGVIMRGQTAHADYIGRAVSHALMEIQLQHEIPVIHEVLLLENNEQARARCLGNKYNRGAEAAQTALEMARVMQTMRAVGKRIKPT
jgi:6,7-dimethyl-8-ribityllumazine synthase